MSKKIKLAIIAIVLFLGLAITSSAWALDVGVNEINNSIQLGGGDPRVIITRIINFSMAFLGVIAVAIVLFAGFKWMTSEGNEENISDAKKILKGGLIGLVIVLTSWGIASFVISRLVDSSTNTGTGESCIDGNTTACGCGGTKICSGNAWGICVGSDCSSTGNGQNNCDATPLTPATCDPDNTVCGSGYFCSNTSCQCESTGGLGASCNVSANQAICQPDNNRCGQYLECKPDTCTCFGPPVISDISPVGGFCQNNINKACSKDSDCTNSTCNTNQPNGQPNNLISIHGFNFGNGSSTPSTTPKIIFVGGISSTDDKNGINPATINSECVNTWTDHEIIIGIPAGVASGPIKVIAANGEDSTDNTIGPVIPDFVANNIQRPGICRLTPDRGKVGETVSYFGSNLKGEAYFGNYESKYKAISSSYNTDGTYNTAVVSNVSTGKTSTFVMDSTSYQPSNYVNFTKDQEPDLGPSISSFEPASGPAGQYVTIYGSGFGNNRNGKIFFSRTGSDIEAAYDFPTVCLHSVWSDNQVIVKVPVGIASSTYSLKMQIGSWTISTASSSKFFNADNSPLAPALCKIEPMRGNNNSPVTVWGEYFGAASTSAQIKFYNNKVVNGLIKNDGNALKIETTVPQDSLTGPVRVVKATQSSNGLNFTVGACSTNTDCGTQFCCPQGTPNEGRCVAGLMDDNNGCYTKVKNSVFEWTFGTSFATDANCDSDADCPLGQICDPLTHVCQNPIYSCAYKASTINSCPTGNCPNSGGQCSPYSGLNKFSSNGVSCDDQDCKNTTACKTGGCVYNFTYNACTKATPQTCDLETLVDFGGDLGKVVKFCNGDNKWEATILGSCPVGWVKTPNNSCVQTGATCLICSDSFSCVVNKANINTGICVTDNICPNGSFCSATSSNAILYKKCVTQDKDDCECCCQIGQDARDCCAPLKCTGTCGNDVTNDGTGFGQCSGCFGAGTTPSARDAACNCSNAQGKYCQADGGDGYCTDCTSLKTAATCADHAQVCCWDDRSGVCRGGSGTVISSVVGNPSYGHCAYYGCDINNVSQCASTTPVFGTTTTEIKGNLTAPLGMYTAVNTCTTGCASTTLCNYINNFVSCNSYNGCCWDAGTITPKCTYGTKLDSKNTTVSADFGYCAYYHCTSASTLPLQCASTTPIKDGLYGGLKTFKDVGSCSNGCSASTYGLGQACTSIAATDWRNSNSTSTTATVKCQPSVCGSPFACLNASGGSNITTADCGFCCCTPNLPADQDSCKKISPDSANLNCVADKGSCSGGSRGLCCGCQKDQECDGGQGLMGCGQIDGCCHSRPDVDAANVFPAQGQTNTCRNISIEVPFTTSMNSESFTDNFLLLEEHNYSDGVCPEGTFIARKYNFIERILAKVSDLFAKPLRAIARLFNISTPALAERPQASKLYCGVGGAISGEQLANGKTVLNFAPNKLLDANTNYFVIVKGVKNFIDSRDGVLDSEGIGMNGQGFLDGSDHMKSDDSAMAFNNVLYPNSFIFNFKTMSDQGTNKGACAVVKAVITPSSYLFKTNKNELATNENGTSYISPSFDKFVDSDKLYVAKALSVDDQLLSPVPGYQWNWNWSNDIQATNFVAGITNLPNSYNDRRLLRVVDGVTDKTTYVQAEVSTAPYSASNFMNDGNGTIGRAPVYIFVCNNPWPPVNTSTGLWKPWSDTCPVGYPSCENFNYELYYCRDAGQSEVTADDLPSILSDLSAQTTNLGTYNAKICSNQKKSCTVDTDCPAGFCVSAVLKESYFFREGVPSFGKMLSATPDSAGEAINLTFEAALPVKAFKIYYNLKGLATLTPVDVDVSKCVSVSGKYSCAYKIGDLVNNKEYEFKFTVINSKDVESAMSNSLSATPKDINKPSIPDQFKTQLFASSTNQVTFSWTKNNDDTDHYIIYMGVKVGQYGAPYPVAGIDTTSATFSMNNLGDGYHYFAISAVDGNNNESDKSSALLTYCNLGVCFAKPCSANTDCPACQNCVSNVCQPISSTDSRCSLSSVFSGTTYYTCLTNKCENGSCAYDLTGTKKPCLYTGDDTGKKSFCDESGACCLNDACSKYQQ